MTRATINKKKYKNTTNHTHWNTHRYRANAWYAQVHNLAHIILCVYIYKIYVYDYGFYVQCSANNVRNTPKMNRKPKLRFGISIEHNLENGRSSYFS